MKPPCTEQNLQHLYEAEKQERHLKNYAILATLLYCYMDLIKTLVI